MSSSGLICARCPRRRRAGLSCRMSEVAAGCAPGRTASRSADGQQRARAAHRRPQRLHGCQHPARCPPFWSLGREHVPATRRARSSSAEHLCVQGASMWGPGAELSNAALSSAGAWRAWLHCTSSCLGAPQARRAPASSDERNRRKIELMPPVARSAVALQPGHRWAARVPHQARSAALVLPPLTRIAASVRVDSGPIGQLRPQLDRPRFGWPGRVKLLGSEEIWSCRRGSAATYALESLFLSYGLWSMHRTNCLAAHNTCSGQAAQQLPLCWCHFRPPLSSVLRRSSRPALPQPRHTRRPATHPCTGAQPPRPPPRAAPRPEVPQSLRRARQGRRAQQRPPRRPVPTCAGPRPPRCRRWRRRPRSRLL